MNQTITLDTPIIRGETNISTVEVRKPASGELRGVTLPEVINMDVSTLIKVLPRITSPALTEQEVAKMDPADLVQLGAEVAAFLLPKRVKPEASPTE